RNTTPRHGEAPAPPALEKLPADRFATAAEFADALKDKTYTSTVSMAAAAAPAPKPAAPPPAGPLGVGPRAARPAEPCRDGPRRGARRGHGRGALGLAPAGASAAAEPVQPRAPPQPG